MKDFDLKNILKRVGAYMADILIVIIIASLITNIPVFKDKYTKYNSKYNELIELNNDYSSILNELKDYYSDNKISDEEYNKLIEHNRYSEMVETIYVDKIIEKKEYDDLISNIKKDYNNTNIDYNYDLQKIGIYNSIVTVSVTLFYFGILQYILKGQTIGKKILNLQVVSDNQKKLNILNFLGRSLIINNVLLNFINIIILNFASKDIFLKSGNIISMIASIIEAITIYLVISRKDNRGLHDLIFNTKVISTK